MTAQERAPGFTGTIVSFVGNNLGLSRVTKQQVSHDCELAEGAAFM